MYECSSIDFLGVRITGICGLPNVVPRTELRFPERSVCSINPELFLHPVLFPVSFVKKFCPINLTCKLYKFIFFQ